MICLRNGQRLELNETWTKIYIVGLDLGDGSMDRIWGLGGYGGWRERNGEWQPKFHNTRPGNISTIDRQMFEHGTKKMMSSLWVLIAQAKGINFHELSISILSSSPADQMGLQLEGQRWEGRASFFMKTPESVEHWHVEKRRGKGI